MKHQQVPVEKQGYVLAWGNEIPLIGGNAIPHDMVAIIGFVLVPRSKMEKLGKFKSCRHALVRFANGEVPVRMYEAVGSNVFLKKDTADRFNRAVNCVAEDMESEADENPG